jgi:hypothetical protein
MSILRIFLAIAVLTLLAGCAAFGGLTVRGTVTLSSMSESGNAVVTVTDGSHSYTTSVLATDSFAFSVTGVPLGTYTATVSFPSPNSCGLESSSVFLNLVSQSSAWNYDFGSSSVIFTVPGITISTDSELDIAMMGSPC